MPWWRVVPSATRSDGLSIWKGETDHWETSFAFSLAGNAAFLFIGAEQKGSVPFAYPGSRFPAPLLRRFLCRKE